MRIGVDASRALRARRTGTENYSLQLIRHLLAQHSGHQFILYCDQAPPRGLFGDNTSGAEVRILHSPRLWTHARLSAEVTLHPPDVLFVPSHVLPVLHPRRSIVTVHDLGYRFFPEAHTRVDRWYLDLSTRFNAAAATRVLADSQATKDDLVQLYGADPSRITVVHLGRDESLAPVADRDVLVEVQRRLGIAPGDRAVPYVLYVGTLQPRKNLARLIEAFACLRHRHRFSNLKLVLAGQYGWLAEGLFRRVADLDLVDRVHFPGFVPDADLAALLSGAQVFAFPSLHEGFGLPILEAQACGVPVLASNTSSLPEVAGNSALLVDPLNVEAIADGIERLLVDTALRRRLRVAGFANCRRFSWERCARETLAVLERC